MNRKLRMGMVGGGKGAFIGAVHRAGAALDGTIELVCGALSSTPEKAKASGRELFLPEDRIYGSYQEMYAAEATRPEGDRMDFVSIVTPNHAHLEPVLLALDAGFHVIIDKPLAFTLAEARQIAQKVEETGLLLGVTYTYAAYPMVKQARHMFQSGVFGAVRKVYVEYPQGWLSTLLEATGNQQAAWRTDPARNGAAGGIGDIGTHAANLAEYISGHRISHLCADLNITVPGRLLDDDANVLLRFDNDARGVLLVSQVAAGDENPLKIRVYGEKGGIEWAQQEPNTLIVKWLDRPAEIYRAGGNHPYLSEIALANCRTPAGHPEGYFSAFANIYRNFTNTLAKRLQGETPSAIDLDFPDVHEGVRGLAFVESVLASAASDQKWYPHL